MMCYSWAGMGSAAAKFLLPGAPRVPRNPPDYNLMSRTVLVVHVCKVLHLWIADAYLLNVLN